MIDRLLRARANDESGFTLIELLVVIAILGILSAVVVFAVGGIKDKGQSSACEIDTRTIRTAEEAFFAQQKTATPAYADEAALVPSFLSKLSTLHDATAVADDTTTPAYDPSYTISVAGPGVGKCGAGGIVGTGDNI